jgi:hypothetical protein
MLQICHVTICKISRNAPPLTSSALALYIDDQKSWMTSELLIGIHNAHLRKRGSFRTRTPEIGRFSNRHCQLRICDTRIARASSVFPFRRSWGGLRNKSSGQRRRAGRRVAGGPQNGPILPARMATLLTASPVLEWKAPTIQELLPDRSRRPRSAHGLPELTEARPPVFPPKQPSFANRRKGTKKGKGPDQSAHSRIAVQGQFRRRLKKSRAASLFSGNAITRKITILSISHLAQGDHLEPKTLFSSQPNLSKAHVAVKFLNLLRGHSIEWPK